jgi:bis(5'-nucleosidyl)-tetraphosphatase
VIPGPGEIRLSSPAWVKERAMDEPLTLSAALWSCREKGMEVSLPSRLQELDFPEGLVEPERTSPSRCGRPRRRNHGPQFSWGRSSKETEPYNRGRKIARYYLAETTRTEISLPLSPELGKPEHQEWRWLTFAEVLSLAPERLRPIVEWAHDLLGNP